MYNGYDKNQYDRYSYFTRKNNEPLIEDTKTKLEIALRHNTKLLDENSTLS